MKNIGDLVTTGLNSPAIVLEKRASHNSSSSEHTERLKKHYHTIYYVLIEGKRHGPLYEDELKSIDEH